MIHLGDKGYALNDLPNNSSGSSEHGSGAQLQQRSHAHKGNSGAMYRPTQGQVDDHRVRMLLYSPEKTCNIILAYGVLHNIALANGVPFADLQPDDPKPRDPWPQEPHVGALRRREDLIWRF